MTAPSPRCLRLGVTHPFSLPCLGMNLVTSTHSIKENSTTDDYADTSERNETRDQSKRVTAFGSEKCRYRDHKDRDNKSRRREERPADDASLGCCTRRQGSRIPIGADSHEHQSCSPRLRSQVATHGRS